MFGIRGLGDDDYFILRAWAEYFGSSDNFPLWFRNTARRERAWPLGRGSRTLHELRRAIKRDNGDHTIAPTFAGVGRGPRATALTRANVRKIYRAGRSAAAKFGQRVAIKGKGWKKMNCTSWRSYDGSSRTHDALKDTPNKNE